MVKVFLISFSFVVCISNIYLPYFSSPRISMWLIQFFSLHILLVIVQPFSYMFVCMFTNINRSTRMRNPIPEIYSIFYHIIPSSTSDIYIRRFQPQLEVKGNVFLVLN
jgi:hypothetical protein